MKKLSKKQFLIDLHKMTHQTGLTANSWKCGKLMCPLTRLSSLTGAKLVPAKKHKQRLLIAEQVKEHLLERYDVDRTLLDIVSQTVDRSVHETDLARVPRDFNAAIGDAIAHVKGVLKYNQDYSKETTNVISYTVVDPKGRYIPKGNNVKVANSKKTATKKVTVNAKKTASKKIATPAKRVASKKSVAKAVVKKAVAKTPVARLKAKVSVQIKGKAKVASPAPMSKKTAKAVKTGISQAKSGKFAKNPIKVTAKKAAPKKAATNTRSKAAQPAKSAKTSRSARSTSSAGASAKKIVTKTPANKVAPKSTVKKTTTNKKAVAKKAAVRSSKTAARTPKAASAQRTIKTPAPAAKVRTSSTPKRAATARHQSSTVKMKTLAKATTSRISKKSAARKTTSKTQKAVQPKSLGKRSNTSSRAAVVRKASKSATTRGASPTPWRGGKIVKLNSKK